MHPLFIGLIFVVAMASPAILLVKYNSRSRKELSIVPAPSQRRLPRAIQGTVVAAAETPVPVSFRTKFRLLGAAKKVEEGPQPAEVERQVSETIHRLILTN